MIKIEFNYNKRSISFVLNRSKIVITRDVNDYWAIRRSIENVLSKSTKSDYSEENNTFAYIKVNDELINKTSELLLVDSKFSIEEEMKLGTKSLLLRYISKVASENMISDEFLQLESMLSLVTDLLSDELIEFEPQPFSYKLLSKIVDCSFLKDEFKCNNLDITYEENILYQLKLIDKIVSLDKHYIVVVDIIKLTSSICKFINEMNNCQVIIVCQFADLNEFQDNLFVDGLDFEDDESLYERMNSMTNIYNLDEFKENLKKSTLNLLKIR